MTAEPQASTLNRSLRLITVGGCLAMVYSTGVASPVTTQFFRAVGATEVHFGLLAGLPMVALAAQFPGAYLANCVRRRKPWFLSLAILSRVLYLAVAFLPLFLWPGSGPAVVLPLVVLVAVSGVLANLTVPLWFTWIGDLVPRRVLSRYWGVRQRYMTLVWTACFVCVAAFTYRARGMSAIQAFPIIVTVACLAGVVDICLFGWVREPENVATPRRRALDVLLEPLRHSEYRTLIVFGCAFSASAVFGAAFMQLYVLEVLALPVWKTTLIWCTYGLGSALVSPAWGRIVDQHGHRPVLLLCVVFKPLVCLVFLLVTARTAFLVLSVCFFLDSMLNGGYAIAVNGYMLTMAPREGRSMFVAAIAALSGIAGGCGAMLAGWFMRSTQDFSLLFWGREWTNYHLLFGLSFVARALCIRLAAAVREPASAPPAVVLCYLRGTWPFRMLLFPVGLYRRLDEPEDDT